MKTFTIIAILISALAVFGSIVMLGNEDTFINGFYGCIIFGFYLGFAIVVYNKIINK